MPKNWTVFELLWLTVFIWIGTAVAVRTHDSLLNYAILVSGILCVVLVAKGSLWNYLFGLFNSVGYAYVSYQNGLYGDFALNLFFFVPTAVAGFLMWRRHMDNATVEMRGLNPGRQLAVASGSLLAVAMLGFFLSRIRTQNAPYLDAAVTVLSVIATLLMLWRFKEQWMLYVALNAVNIFMWLTRWQDGSRDAGMMILMWSAFLVNSVYGYMNWHRRSEVPVREACI